jgi:hypothetical protein
VGDQQRQAEVAQDQPHGGPHEAQEEGQNGNAAQRQGGVKVHDEPPRKRAAARERLPIQHHDMASPQLWPQDLLADLSQMDVLWVSVSNLVAEPGA